MDVDCRVMRTLCFHGVFSQKRLISRRPINLSHSFKVLQNVSVIKINVYMCILIRFQQTEAAERGRAEERRPERGSRGRSAGGVRELAGRGRALQERAGVAPGPREEDGGGCDWETDGIKTVRGTAALDGSRPLVPGPGHRSPGCSGSGSWLAGCG